MQKKKFALLFVILALLVSTTVFAYENNEAYDAAEPTATILHTNDIHGRFLPSGTAIGIDTVASIYAQTPNSILVDAGDTFHGLPFATLNRGMDIVELMNAAGYSLFTPGNHDFNFGTDRLLELEAAADFGFISANVFAGDDLLFDAIAIREINGVRIGFFGLASPDTYHLTNPANVVGITFTDPIEAARDSVALLQEMDVDLIVAIAHLGSGARSDYRVDGWAIDVAEAVEGIDIIVDGHSHTLHEEGLLIGDTLIVQSGDHGRNLGRVDIFVEDGEISIVASIISRDYAVENFDPDENVSTLIAEIEARQSEEMDVVVAYLPVTLYQAEIRSQEMPLGNLIADAIRWAAGTQLAFTNGGGIRDVLEAGDVTKGDIISVLPFGNYVVTLEVTPAILAAAMENGVSALPGGGRFPQVSGFSFTFNPDAKDGQRVISISVDGVELDLEDTTTVFTLATNNFIMAGGDAFTMFVDLPILLELGNQDEILIEYMNYADLENLAVEGRIVAVTEEYVPAEEEDVPVEEEYVPVEEDVPVEEEYVPVEEEEEVPVEEEYVPVEEEYVPVEEDVPAEEPAPVAPPVGVTTARVVNCWMLNVRAGGGVRHNVINVLRVGDVVTVLDSNAWGWYKIQTADVTGWVFGRYLDISN
jgi:5'-nucleotidase